jgi:DNA processing protein
MSGSAVCVGVSRHRSGEGTDRIRTRPSGRTRQSASLRQAIDSSLIDVGQQGILPAVGRAHRPSSTTSPCDECDSGLASYTIEQVFALEDRLPVSSLRERACVVALAHAAPGPWHAISDLVEGFGSALAVLERPPTELELIDPELAVELASRVSTRDVDAWEEQISELLAMIPDLSLVTVLDDDYPENLREIFNRPPFLFIRGSLVATDADSVAVVGTRSPSPEGTELARDLSAALAERGVTVISGLARGIDTAAHEAALHAGGRTVAVMGTGITRIYPAENVELAEAISQKGALISQFGHESPPRRSNFPIRNAVTSGMAIGTVVVEASSTSGAKMQARLALEHGKQLFLVETLVLHEDWAQRYAERPGVLVVRTVDEILDRIARRVRPAAQLRLV